MHLLSNRVILSTRRQVLNQMVPGSIGGEASPWLSIRRDQGYESSDSFDTTRQGGVDVVQVSRVPLIQHLPLANSGRKGTIIDER